MNFVGHIHLARRYRAVAGQNPGADPSERGFLVGAALPDLAAIGRFRLTAPAPDPSVRAGVAIHHRTDEAFHRHPWFRRHSRAVTVELEQAGLGRGPARACGHVGVELLLDGRFLADDPDLGAATVQALADGAEPVLDLDTVVAEDRRAAWLTHRRRLASWDLPTDYDHPPAVAGRLQRILSRRPRLALSPDAVPALALILARRQPMLEAGIDELVEDLTSQLLPAEPPAR